MVGGLPPVNTDELGTARIINRAFPTRPLRKAPDEKLTVTELHGALFRARRFSGSESVIGCIDWARGVTRNARKSLRDRLRDRVDRALQDLESNPEK